MLPALISSARSAHPAADSTSCVPVPAIAPEPICGAEDISTELLLNRRSDYARRSRSMSPGTAAACPSARPTSARCSARRGRPRPGTASVHRRRRVSGAHYPYADHVITQVATGLFGVREETIQRARDRRVQVRPGRQARTGRPPAGRQEHAGRRGHARSGGRHSRLFSPFPFHSVYSVEDHKKHLDWIAHMNPRALLSAKVSTPADVDMVAVGVYYAGAHIVHLDGSYGGTGAAPNIAKKNIAMPIEYAINQGAPIPGRRRHPRRDHGDRQRRHPHAGTWPRPLPWAPTAS